ncbi:sodium- and chloride-dependent neutral and basic amino acid transporter B(0+)-like [Amphiura filiformis]|uniref:sodium- and chloride-dependent neutral and basic amino acid transporter B(0+)-like n=1 Tax=Amphiura filiformis TaxID=82378 RepID=UPI003B20D8AD
MGDPEVKMVKVDDDGDENKERGNWGNKMDFILSCLGYAVGLGNVWRFPYLTFQNGGGAFLIPYFLMLALAGLPIFFLEVSFGQYCSEGPITAWRAVPMFRGIGYGMVLVSFYVGISYNVIIMYACYYLFSSFTSQLPWVGCGRSHNTIYCSDLYSDCVNMEYGQGIILNNGSCANLTAGDLSDEELMDYNVTELPGGMYNISDYTDPLFSGRQRPSQEFWENGVLRQADNMNETGGVVWQLALCLLFAWLIVFGCLIKGIKSSGKVVYVTATFPYLVLIILLIRGVTLPGYQEGIKFYITPVWSTLAKPRVWLDATTQIFYSLSAAWGGLLTLASYNKFHNNCYTDSLFVALANCATSFFAGFAIFSIVGFMSHELGVPVQEVAKGGFGLAFVAYPEAVALMPVSPLWAILFFLMLITLGLDSQFAIIETVVTAIIDEFPQLRKKKTYVLGVVCCVGYLLGFTCVTRTGPYWASLIDSYSTSFSLLLFAIMECIGLSYIYGVRRFMNDIRTMIGDPWVDFVGFYWWPFLWCLVTPGLLTFVIIFNWANWSEPSYNGEYPPWAQAIGWMLTISVIIWIPVVMVFEFLRSSGSAKERLQTMSKPRGTWGPALQKFRDEAWEVHLNHGTTMGGNKEKTDSHGVKYSADKGADNAAYTS